MARTLFLTEPAWAALQREKKPGESESHAVLRLIEEARSRRKDPWHFVRTRKLRKRMMSPEKHLEYLERMREKERPNARRNDFADPSDEAPPG